MALVSHCGLSREASATIHIRRKIVRKPQGRCRVAAALCRATTPTDSEAPWSSSILPIESESNQGNESASSEDGDKVASNCGIIDERSG